MKGKTRQEKGITLIALIITIVVLLILAVVTINSIKGDGIITYADNSTEQYKKEEAKEQGILKQYEAYLSGRWTQDGATLTKTSFDGKQIMQIKIGDYVNYNEGEGHTHTPDTTKGVGTATFGTDSQTGKKLLTTPQLETKDLGWRVLGVNEKGQIELISDTETPQGLCLANEEAYLNVETKNGQLGTLDAFCNDLYGKGDYATGARSLNLEDINKLAKFDVKSYTIGGISYGDKVIFKYPTAAELSNPPVEGLTKNIWYRVQKPDGTYVTDWANTTYQTFRLPGEETELNEENTGTTKEIIYSGVYYPIASNITTEDGYTAEEATIISNMLRAGSGNSYWLATTNLSGVGSLYCDIFYVDNSVTTYTGMYTPDGSHKEGLRKVRPVVTLELDCELTVFENNMWKITSK